MAFYSILFGILFLGALREIIRAVGLEQWIDVWTASSLAVIIFNDVLYTSHFIEEEKNRYTIAMKVSDIVSFLLLSTALLALQPKEVNIFEASPGSWFESLPRLPLFWGCIVSYWITLIGWNWLGTLYRGTHVKRSVHILILVGLAAVLVSYIIWSPLSNPWIPFVVFIILAIYSWLYKPFVFRGQAGKALASGSGEA